MPSASANQKLTVSLLSLMLGREEDGDVRCRCQIGDQKTCGRKLVASRGKVMCPKCKTEHTLLDLLANQIGPWTHEVRGITERLLKTSRLARAQAGAASLGYNVEPSKWLLDHSWLISVYGFVPVYLPDQNVWILVWNYDHNSEGCARFIETCHHTEGRRNHLSMTASQVTRLIAELNNHKNEPGHMDPKKAVFTIPTSESSWRKVHEALTAVLCFSDDPKYRRPWSITDCEWVYIENRFQIINAGAVIYSNPDPNHAYADLRLIVKQPPEQPLVL